MNIKVLGSGCRKCQAVADHIQRKVDETGVNASVAKVTDTADIMAYGVMNTPAVVVDEAVVHAGSAPSDRQIAEWLGR